MSRIRAIKPEFFRHEALYEAERAERMPLRLAFAGLWTVADREGRFRWRPRELKLDCLPYDEVDFSRVLDALMTRGFIVKYESEGEYYGWIPTFKDHQIVNPRERQSVLPEPNNSNTCTREVRVDDASPTRQHLARGELEKEEELERKGNSEPIGSAADAPRDIRTELFREGLDKLVEMTGKTPDSARAMIGKWLKQTSDEALHVKAAIDDAYRNRIADPVPWITRGLQSKFTDGKPKRTVQDAARDLREKFGTLLPGDGGTASPTNVRLLSSG